MDRRQLPFFAARHAGWILHGDSSWMSLSFSATRMNLASLVFVEGNHGDDARCAGLSPEGAF